MDKFIRWWKTPVTQQENLFFISWFMASFVIMMLPFISIKLISIVITCVLLSKMLITGYEDD